MASRSREGILLLCSALMRPHQESCIQHWSPQHRKACWSGSREATKMIRGLAYLCYEEKLRDLGGYSALRREGCGETS